MMRVCYGPMIPQIKAQFKGYFLETRTVSLATPVSPAVNPAQPLDASVSLLHLFGHGRIPCGLPPVKRSSEEGERRMGGDAGHVTTRTLAVCRLAVGQGDKGSDLSIGHA